MNDNERFWNENADELRRFKGLCPLTPAEASDALKKMPQHEASDDDVDFSMDAVMRGELPNRDDGPLPDWTPECDFAAMDREAALCRNRGDHDPEGDKAEEDLFNELLSDDAPEEDEDGLGG